MYKCKIASQIEIKCNSQSQYNLNEYELKMASVNRLKIAIVLEHATATPNSPASSCPVWLLSSSMLCLPGIQFFACLVVVAVVKGLGFVKFPRGIRIWRIHKIAGLHHLAIELVPEKCTSARSAVGRTAAPVPVAIHLVAGTGRPINFLR